ncbi:predicted protein [Plenodomus lingam JN3]|uniref:Predicted protein n=1 Tax=Leptosphaeria maculans (strain JN3 / isolate v23.1.3 / race Av1-4-5-6-7-8) TaxID=985895 RepID=E5A819_LEPMJ|nr:predicted protein [Plenodomus lingam JN3]CBX99764.1 predicted protein [Plenodomus lingam JN3]
MSRRCTITVPFAQLESSLSSHCHQNEYCGQETNKELRPLVRSGIIWSPVNREGVGLVEPMSGLKHLSVGGSKRLAVEIAISTCRISVLAMGSSEFYTDRKFPP